MTLEMAGKTWVRGRIETASKEQLHAPRGLTVQIDSTDWRATVNGTRSSHFVPRPIRNTVATFWQHVEPTGFCWQWTGTIGPEGYALYWLNGQSRPVHRIAYELLVGTIPADRHIDHLCRNRSCVNPDHLEIVTPAENSRRANKPKVERTHCNHGHEWTPENTLPLGDSKRCRQCILVRTHRKRGKDCSYEKFCDAEVHRRGKYEPQEFCKRGHPLASAPLRAGNGRVCLECVHTRNTCHVSPTETRGINHPAAVNHPVEGLGRENKLGPQTGTEREGKNDE